MILVIGGFLAFSYNIDSLGWLFTFILFLISVISIDDLKVETESFDLANFYLYGFIKRKKRFTRNEIINSRPISGDFGESGAIYVDDGYSTGIGCLLSIFFCFNPPKIKRREFYVEMLSANNSVIESAYILLNQQEFCLLKNFLYKPQST